MTISSKNKDKWWQDIFIYILAFVALFALLIIGWSANSAIQTKYAYQKDLMKNEARSVSLAIKDYMRERLRLMKLFADQNASLLSAFVREGESGPSHKKVADHVKKHFPHHFAFTIRTQNKEFIPDDFGEFVGEVCRIDINEFWHDTIHGADNDTSPYKPMIHPQPHNYHFDTMTKWQTDSGQDAVFFVSFHPVDLVNIIVNYQLPGHRIIIVRNDQTDLIELTANGARDQLGGNIRLNAEEQSKVMVTLPIENTRWVTLVMPETDFFENQNKEIYTRAFIQAFAVIFLWIGGTLLLLYTQHQKRQVDDIIEEQNERFARAQEVAHVGCWDLDMQTNNLQWTDEIYNIFGRSKENFSATYENFMQCVHPEDRALVSEAVERAVKEDVPYDIKHRILLPDGKISYVAEKGKVYFGKDGKPVRMLGVVLNITDNVLLDKAKSEFIATVSHELRTPLTSIKGSFSFLSNNKLSIAPDESGQIFDIANRNIDRLINLVNDLLDLEKLQSGQMEFDFKVYNISHIIAEAVESCAGMATERDIQILVGNPLPEALTKVDKGRTIQVITNLLSNAIKFSEIGGTVKVNLATDNHKVTIAVEDDGPGIPEDYLDKIFDRFTQVDASDKRTQQGTGLGLSICRKIIHEMGGEIYVKSTYGEGSTFYFDLPKAT